MKKPKAREHKFTVRLHGGAIIFSATAEYLRNLAMIQGTPNETILTLTKGSGIVTRS